MISLYIIAAHLTDDFLAQTDEMAQNKFDSRIWRTMHVLTYTMMFLPVVAFTSLPVLFLASVAIPHWIIDTRRWAEPKEEFESYPIVVDQTLHIVSLAIAAGIFV